MSQEGKLIKIPKAIKKMLLADEQVMAVIKQSRLKVEDFRYEDIANLKIDKGILFATITVKRRFMSEDLILDNLPEDQVDYVFRLIQDNLRRMGNATPSPITTNQQTPLTSSENPLQILKLRFARGEITKEQFEEMKKVLE